MILNMKIVLFCSSFLCFLNVVNSEDCDSSGVDDLIEISEGILNDCNGDGVPDVCELAFDNPTFNSPVVKPVLGASRQIELLDLQNDGDIDIVAGYYDNISVHIAEQPGEFKAELNYSTRQLIVDFSIFDLDEDGDFDVIAANEDQDELYVFLGEEDGSLSRIDDIDLPAPAGSIEHGDIDGDGFLDVVTTHFDRDGAFLLIHFGEQGTAFTASERFAIFFSQNIKLGDLNSDSRTDIILPHGDRIRVYLSQENRQITLTNEILLEQRDRVGKIEISDVNDDSKLDLILTHTDKDSLSVRSGEGNGEFSEPVEVDTGEKPSYLTTGDLDGDGVNDIACVSVNGIFTHLMNSQGQPGSGIRHSGLLDTKDIKISDIDGDGLNDVITTEGVELVFSLGLGDGNLIQPTYITGPVDLFPPVVGDFDGDGLEDFLLARNRFIFLISRNSEGEIIKQEFPLPDRIVSRGAIAVDINRDEKLDLFLQQPSMFLINDGSGHFTFQEPPEKPPSQGRDYVFDLNGDGALEFISADLNSPSFTLRIIYGDPEGGFTDQVHLTTNLREFDQIVGGDLDGDGFPDLALSNDVQDFVSIRFNEGDGKFRSTLTLELPGRLVDGGLLIDDVNKDSRLDLITVLHEGVAVFPGVGERALGEVIFSPGDWMLTPALRDLNGDGAFELIGARYNSILVWNGDGTGRFPGFKPFLTGTAKPALGVADLDGDLSPEILATITPARFGPTEGFIVLENLTSAPIDTDCNGNGMPDSCDLSEGGDSKDVDQNGIPDECQLDCNDNDIPDSFDIETNFSEDIDDDRIPDECAPDCNENLIPDSFEIAMGQENDLDLNGVPDSCQEDCNNNQVPDSLDIETGASRDDNQSGVPDECENDCNQNGILDNLDIDQKPTLDCNNNLIIDSCEIEMEGSLDVDQDGILDRCQGALQLPGDTDQDGDLSLNDATLLLKMLFLDRALKYPCEGDYRSEANISLLDWQRDSVIDLSDVIMSLRFLYLGGPPPRRNGKPFSCIRIFGCSFNSGCLRG